MISARIPVSSRHSRTAHLGRCFPDVLGAAGKSPLPSVAAALQQNRAGLVHDEQVAGRDQAIGLRGIRVVVVLSSTHRRGFPPGQVSSAERGPTRRRSSSHRHRTSRSHVHRRWTTGLALAGWPKICGLTNN